MNKITSKIPTTELAHVGVGSWVTFSQDDYGTHRLLAVSETENQVEVIFWANPAQPERRNSPVRGDERHYEWVLKADITFVNGHEVVR